MAVDGRLNMNGDQSTLVQKAPTRLDESLLSVAEGVVHEERRPGRETPVEVAEEALFPPLPATQEIASPPVLTTWVDLRGFWQIFASVEWLLRDRASFFIEIRDRKALGVKLRDMVVSTAILFSFYGLMMGTSNSPQQALSSAVKLPSLFLITLFVCLPTLYFFNLLFGSQLTFRQTAALIVAALNVTGALSLAFASITLTFWLTVPDYSAFLLLNVGVLALMSWWGLSFLIQGMRLVQEGYLGVRRRRMLLFWILIYAFVGTQMAWALRPFVGAPTAPFELIRESQGTFYTGVFHNLRQLLGF
jgi:hypothetical protein